MDWAAALSRVPRGVLVTVASVEGSGPREPGAWMLVLVGGETLGTIGGGRLAHDAMAIANGMLLQADAQVGRRRFALGPSLGQCCGGVVHLAFEPVGESDVPRLR